MASPTTDQIRELADRQRQDIPTAALSPYNRELMVREVEIDSPTSATGKRTVKRRVARTIEEAEKFHYDFYHPGGSIVELDGTPRGSHPAGWFLGGYKWASDRPENIIDE